MLEFEAVDPQVLAAPFSPKPYVHSDACVHNSAIIGPGTKVWAGASVDQGAVIGMNCVIARDTYIGNDVTVGDGSKVQHGGMLPPGVSVGKCVFWGPGALATNDHNPRADNTAWNLVCTRIENGASIGAAAIIIGGNTIGERALVGAGTLVTRPVPPYGLVLGSPGRHLGWVNGLGAVISRDASEVPEELQPVLKERGLMEGVREFLAQEAARRNPTYL